MDGVRFDEPFARDLHRAINVEMGNPEDADSGAFVSAGARVLQARYLVENSYTLQDLEELTLVLLEHGPIVASVNWQDSMSTPEQIAGHAVCRWDHTASPIGGHAILLNGIDMDLTLGDVKGFVRFKNSWGREWADHGQCLISVEDLGSIIRFDQETLLPIPPRAVLPEPEQQDVASEDDGPIAELPPLTRFQDEAFGTDFWTIRDTAGMGAYANAIARGIQHADTKPPLTIGIRAPWGAGKTSLMRMIRDRLEWPTLDALERRPAKYRSIRLTPSSVQELAPATGKEAARRDPVLHEVTNGVVLQQVDSLPPLTDEPEAETTQAAPSLRATPNRGTSDDARLDEDAQRWRPTVWFNPWMYQTGEQVWAGLAHEIISEITTRMDPVEREHFWLRLNLKRVDQQAVRRKIYGLVLDRLIPYALMAAVLLVGGLVLLAIGGPALIGVGAAGSSPVLIGILSAVQYRRVLRARVTSSLAPLVAPSTAVRRFAGEELGGSYGQLVEAPDYRTQAGFFYLVQTDMKRVLDLIASEKRPLVVFVDDLDRCSPNTVVQVIEAMNLFLAGQFPNCLFVIAMEPEMVAAHVETAYAGLVMRLTEEARPGAGTNLGWRFLEKIVQLPLTLPDMSPAKARTFVETLFGSATVQSTSGAITAALEATAPAGEDVAKEQRKIGDVSLKEAIQLAGAKRDGGAKSEAQKEAVRRQIERRLTGEDPAVQAAILYAVPHLDPNPREIKRFVNIFRFFVMILTERSVEDSSIPLELQDIAKLAVLNLKWPWLMQTLAEPARGGRQGTVFDLLQDPPVVTPRKGESRAAAELRILKQALKINGFSQSTMDRLLAPELRSFMASPPKVGPSGRLFL
jgi:hypothetical protein